MSSDARSQRRQLDPDHVEPVVEILAELSARNAILKILVRSRDHPDIDANRCLAADPIKLPFSQHAQQPRLQGSRHVADLIEEQRAAIRLLEPAATLRVRTRESPLLVPEQLRLEQVGSWASITSSTLRSAFFATFFAPATSNQAFKLLSE